MRTIVVLAVFVLILLGFARSAEAGVMLQESSVPAISDGCIASGVPESTAIPDEEQQRNVHQDDLSGMSGNSVSAGQSVSPSATVGEMGIFRPQLLLLDVFELANEVLPDSPVFDGLLKPT